MPLGEQNLNRHIAQYSKKEADDEQRGIFIPSHCENCTCSTTILKKNGLMPPVQISSTVLLPTFRTILQISSKLRTNFTNQRSVPFPGQL
jgi:hypothetical protein